mmetsp:Transcript_29099/g.46747  ORF Transcript_29099/g.46747 Transcript_29099/m.46747 type:complete len:192 (-) Transcript_29099:208-783(-)
MGLVKNCICLGGATAAAVYMTGWGFTGIVSTGVTRSINESVEGVMKKMKLQELANKIWEDADADKNGFLDRNEVKDLLSSIMIQISNEVSKEVAHMKREEKTKAKYALDKARSSLEDPANMKTWIDLVFKTFDANQDGKISKEEFRSALKQIPGAVTSVMNAANGGIMLVVGANVLGGALATLGCLIGLCK